MSLVVCAVCNKSMTVINNRHLQSHGLTADAYKERFPNSPMISEDALKKKKASAIKSNLDRKGKKRTEKEIQSIKKGIAASNKSIKRAPMSDATKEKISLKHKKAFADGRIHPRLGKPVDIEIRNKIASSLVGRKIGSEAALKAIKTKQENGIDLAFFRGKQHSLETKKLIGLKSKEYANKTRFKKREPMLDRIVDAGLRIQNSIEENIFQLECITCGYVFTRTPQMFQPSKFHTHICDQCFPISPVSKAENDIADYINSLGFDCIRSDSEIITPLELDIFIPEKNIAIEYCGLYWHSELFRNRYYHRVKWNKCREKGIKLITIFEDEWLNKRNIVCSKIDNLLNKNTTKIYARKCSVIELTDNSFVDIFHLQGGGRSNVKYGLEFNGEIVSAMTFSKSELSRKISGWDVNRFCSKSGVNVIGGAGKLFSHFLNENKPKEVTSYADLRWGDGSVYGHLGFTFVDYTVPGYWYFRPNEMKRYHRFSLRKKADEPKHISEYELRTQEGWMRIWDCGNAKWKYVTSY